MLKKTSLISVTVCCFLVASCGLEEKANEISANIDEAQAMYDSFNLACSFEEVAGYDDAAEEDSGASITEEGESEEACDETEAAEMYTSMVDSFDKDGDGEISEAEEEEMQQEFADHRLANLDLDGDGSISKAEKDAWREKHADKVADRKAKREVLFAQACERLNKEIATCRKMRTVKKAKIKKEIMDNFASYDTDQDGILSVSEREAIKSAFKAKHKEQLQEKSDQLDTDGDGKVSPEERQEARKARSKRRAELRKK